MRPRGYTLVEMSVTLIIIGLLLTGVLVAEALLQSARVRGFVREADALAVAVRLYKARYGAWPGDDATAGSRWPGVANGNGNGLLGGRYDRAAPADTASLGNGNDDSESLLVWWHLRRAGFVTGPTEGAASVAPPLSAVRQPLGIQSDLLGIPGTVACVAGVSGATAEAIDRSMDDGVPNTGRVRATTGGAASTAYLHDPAYQVCVSLEERVGPALFVVTASNAAEGSAESGSSGKGKSQNKDD